MSNWIVKYEKLFEVITYSKKKYYIKAKNVEALDKAVETKKFITIWTARINVNSIDTYDEAKQEDNFLIEILKQYSDKDKNIINTQIKFWKDKTMNTKILTTEVLDKIIEIYVQK